MKTVDMILHFEKSHRMCRMQKVKVKPNRPEAFSTLGIFACFLCAKCAPFGPVVILSF